MHMKAPGYEEPGLVWIVGPQVQSGIYEGTRNLGTAVGAFVGDAVGSYKTGQS